VGALALAAGLGTLAYSQNAHAADLAAMISPHLPTQGVALALVVGGIFGFKAILEKVGQMRAISAETGLVGELPRIAREYRSRLTGKVLPRSIEASDFSGAANSYPYELHLNDLDSFLTVGFMDTAAWREGKEIRLKTTINRPVDASEGYSEGTRHLSLQVSEDGNTGNLMLFLEKGTLNLYNIHTRNLGKGAGTILLDWVASQAAAKGLNFNVRCVEEAQVFRILERSRLLVPGSDSIEGVYSDPKTRESVSVEGKMSDAVFPDEPWSASYNLFAKPNPNLVPEALKKKL